MDAKTRESRLVSFICDHPRSSAVEGFRSVSSVSLW